MTTKIGDNIPNGTRAQLLSLFIILFTGTITISLIFTILNNTNFYPFNTTKWQIYNINVLGDYSITAIVKAIYMYLNYTFKFILLLLLTNHMRVTSSFLSKLFYSLFSANIIIFLVFLYQILIDPGLGNLAHWKASNRINATMTDPNSFGYFLVLNIGLFAALLFYSTKRQRLLCILAILISVMELPFTGCRTALLGLAIFVLVTLVYFIGYNMENGVAKKDKKILSRSIIAAFALIIIIGLSIAFLTNIERFANMPTVLERIKVNIQTIGAKDFWTQFLSYRNIIWPQAINMIKDYPLTGVGIGISPLELSNYYKLFNVDGKIIDYLLNYALQILAENGILTFIFFAGFYITVFLMIISNLRTIVNYKSKMLLISLTITIIASILMSNTIPGTNFFENQVFHSFILSFAFILSIEFKKEDESQKKSKLC